jgi:prophage regulatory protein
MKLSSPRRSTPHSSHTPGRASDAPTNKDAAPRQVCLLRMPEVVQRVGFSESTVWRQVKARLFPQPVRVSSRMRAWRSDEVEHWIEQRPRHSEHS